MTALPTKLGQGPTSSPRTTENNRRRLGGLFSALSLSSGSTPPTAGPSKPPIRQASSEANETPTKPASKGGWLTWLTPTMGQNADESDDEEEEATSLAERSQTRQMQSRTGDDRRTPKGQREIDLSKRNVPAGTVSSFSLLEQLPDEILIDVLLQLPPSAVQLLSVSLISKRFYSLSQSFELWASAFAVAPGFALVPGLARHIQATDVPPGEWSGSTYSPASPKPAATQNGRESLPVHYPTLFRSRHELYRAIRSGVSTDPPWQVSLRAHGDSVYCVHLASPWIITGSRDKSIRFWRLDDLDTDGCLPASSDEKLVKTIEQAHGGSVLSVRFEMDEDTRGGTLVSGSSDLTAGVWRVVFSDSTAVEVERIGTLQGHTGGVLDVALGRTRIATCSKDTTIRIYDRTSLAHLHTLTGHHMPINSLAVNSARPTHADHLISASSDGHWVMWDMITGEEILRGAGEGRGLACVTWADNFILTGDTDRFVKIFSASDASLLRTIEGHTDLVRSLSVDLNHRIIVSGSYDNSVRLWDLDTGQLVRVIRDVHTSSVFGVATERGRVASVSHDATIGVTTYGADLPYRGLFL